MSRPMVAPLNPLFALVYTIMVLHVVLSGYAAWRPDVVYRTVSSPDRSFVAWAFLFSLRTWRGDSESDLLQPGLASDVGVANCQRRAWINFFSGLAGLVLLAFLFGLPGLQGHYRTIFTK